MENKELTLLQTLSEQQKMYVTQRTTSYKQSSTAYILWFVFGVHYFYLGKPFINILYWLTGAGLGVWGVIDLFRIPGMVRSYNKKVLRDAVEEAKVLYPTE